MESRNAHSQNSCEVRVRNDEYRLAKTMRTNLIVLERNQYAIRNEIPVSEVKASRCRAVIKPVVAEYLIGVFQVFSRVSRKDFQITTSKHVAGRQRPVLKKVVIDGLVIIDRMHLTRSHYPMG